MMKAVNKKITIDKLAAMTQRGFVALTQTVKEGFREANNNIRILSENNAREHDEIKLRLDNVAYRFELVELQKRVEALEKRAGLKNK